MPDSTPAKVTDPKLLEQLNSNGATLAKVTNPALLRQLNGASSQKEKVSSTLGENTDNNQPSVYNDLVSGLGEKQKDISDLSVVGNNGAASKVVANNAISIPIKDIRKSDLATGGALATNLSGTADANTVKNIVSAAIKNNVDPYTALAVAYQETKLADDGSTEGNPFHLIDNASSDLYDAGIKLLKQKLEMGQRLGKKDEASLIQAFNGYGNVGANTEGQHKSFYGIDVSKTPIDMNSNPVYGKRILDIRDNILKQNPQLKSIVDSVTQKRTESEAYLNQNFDNVKSQLDNLISQNHIQDFHSSDTSIGLHGEQPQTEEGKRVLGESQKAELNSSISEGQIYYAPPNIPDARIKIEGTAIAQKNPEFAAASKVAQQNQGDEQSNLILANGFLSYGNLEGAALHYNQILQAHPNNPDALQGLGYIEQKKNNNAEALAYYKRAQAIDPTNVNIANSVAYNLLQVGDVSGAKNNNNAVIRAIPNQPSALLIKSLIETKEGSHEYAQATLQQAIDENITQSQPLNDLRKGYQGIFAYEALTPQEKANLPQQGDLLMKIPAVAMTVNALGGGLTNIVQSTKRLMSLSNAANLQGAEATGTEATDAGLQFIQGTLESGFGALMAANLIETQVALNFEFPAADLVTNGYASKLLFSPYDVLSPPNENETEHQQRVRSILNSLGSLVVGFGVGAVTKAAGAKLIKGEDLSGEEFNAVKQTVPQVATPENVQALRDAVQKVPKDLSEEKTAEVIPLIAQKQITQQQIQDIEAGKATLDPVFHEAENKKVADLQNKIDQTDTEIKTVLDTETKSSQAKTEGNITTDLPSKDKTEPIPLPVESEKKDLGAELPQVGAKNAQTGEVSISKAYDLDKQKDKFSETKVVDENGNPKEVYHGTWSDVPFEDFKDGDVYFTDNYDTAKMFGINREGGVDVQHMDLQKKPFVMTVVDKKGNSHRMVIAHSDMSAIFSDLDYDVSPVGKWGKEDLKSGFDPEAIEYHFNIKPKDIKSFDIEEKQVGKGVDEFGVSKHYINLKNPLVIDAKGDVWNGSKGGDIQGEINKARESGIHDGVIVKNIVEGGLSNPDTKPTTTYVVFNKKPENISSQLNPKTNGTSTNSPKAEEAKVVPSTEVVPPATKLQAAKQRLADAKNKAKEAYQNLGIDPFETKKRQAQADRELLDSYIDVAREAVNEGIKNVADFAKELGEDVSEHIKRAWDVVNGTMKYEDAVKDIPPVKEIKDVTQITKAVMEQEWQHMRIDNPYADQLSRDFPSVIREAADKIKSGEVNPDELARDPNKYKDLNPDTRNAILLIEKRRIQNLANESAKQYADAVANGDEGEQEAARLRLAALQDRMVTNLKGMEEIGTALGRGLNSLKMALDHDYNLVTMQAQERMLRGDKQLSPEVEQQIKDLHAKIEDATKKYEDAVAKHQEEMKAAQEKIDKLQNQTQDKGVKARAKKLADNIRKLKAKELELHDENGNKIVIQKSGLDWNDLVEGIAQAVEKGGDLADSIIRHLEGASWYQALTDKGKEAVQKQLSDHFNKTGLTDQEKKIATYNKKEQEYRDRIAKNDFEKKKNKPLPITHEVMKAKANMERARDEWRMRQEQLRLKNRTGYEKFLDTFTKVERAFKLSNIPTFGKLVAAAIHRLTTTPLYETAGGVWSTFLPKIADKAHSEGYVNVKAEGKAIAESYKVVADLLTLNKDGQIIKTLKTGKSDIDLLYGKKSEQFPPEVLGYIGQLHGAIKILAKYPEFQRAFEKITASYERSGVDVSDPMVQMQIGIESYKSANRAIFMQDNSISSGYQAMVNYLKSKGDFAKTAGAGFQWLVPFVKVPTNIAGEVGTHIAGLPVGGFKVMKAAFTKGLDSISPEEADIIMRNLKKGSIGAAAIAIGYMNPSQFGGLYQPDIKRKKGDVGYGGMKAFGVDVPAWMLHNPLYLTMQLGATVRRVKDYYEKKHDPEATTNAAFAGALGLAQQVPFIGEGIAVNKIFDRPQERRYFFDELAKNTIDPAALQNIAQWMDNADQRYPRNMKESVESGIPVLRENVPAKKKK